MNDDELPGSPLWDALRAPGTADELSGEEAALAAFRSATADRRRRRVHRLGVAGAGLLLFAAAGSGGVAAAATNNLPSPVQDAVATIFPVFPKSHPHHRKPYAGRSRSATPSSSPSPRRTHLAQAGPAPSTGPVPTATAVPAPTPSAAAAPSPTATPTPGATLTASTSATSLLVHSDLTVRGRLMRGDSPVGGVQVSLARKYPDSSWTRIGHATTGADGSVQLVDNDVQRNASYRLVSQGVTSGQHPVVVRPAVSITVTAPGPKRRVLNVTTDGAVAGDAVQLQRYDGTSWQTMQRGTLDSSAATTFTVGTPASGQKVRYRVLVLKTTRHGLGSHTVTLQG